MRRVLALCLLAVFLSGCLNYFGSERLKRGEVTLQWEMKPKSEVYGFRVFRADRLEGPYREVTDEAIPAIDPRSGEEPKYSFTDRQVVLGQDYYYSIEAVNVVKNRTERIQPIIRVVATTG